MNTKNKLWFLLKINPLPFILYWIVIFVGNILLIASAVCLQKIFDIYSEPYSEIMVIYSLVGTLVIVHILRALGAFTIGGLEKWCGFYIDSFLKTKVVKYIFDTYGAKYSEKATGELQDILKNDTSKISTFLLEITEMSAIYVYTCILLFVLFQVNSRILLAVIAISCISIVLVQIGYNKLSRLQRKARESDSKVSTFIGEIVASTFAIKMAGKENSILEHFDDLAKNRGNMNVNMCVLNQLLSSANQIAFNLGQGIVLLMSFRMIQMGMFSIGDFILFTSLFSIISNVVSATAQVLSGVPQLKIAFNRLEELVKSFDIYDDSEQYKTKLYRAIYQKGTCLSDCEGMRNDDYNLKKIDVKDVSVKSEKGTNILENISFSLQRGSITVISGQTATGKTMLIRAVMGLYPIETGKILWNGIDIYKPNYLQPPYAAYTSQNLHFLSDSICNNIMLEERDKMNIEDKIKYVSDKSVFEQDLSNLEAGIDTILGKKGTKVSGGQAKRIGLMRMYFREAQVYVIDDVASALDLNTERELWRQVRMQTDKTFLIVSNSRYAMEIADQIIYLKRGKMKSYKGLEEAMLKSEDIRKMLQV